MKSSEKPQPNTTPRSKITDWFQRCTPKEREEQIQRDRVKDMEAREEFLRRERLQELKVKEKRKKSNTESQRRTRARKRQHEIEEGGRGLNGKKIKIAVDEVSTTAPPGIMGIRTKL